MFLNIKLFYIPLFILETLFFIFLFYRNFYLKEIVHFRTRIIRKKYEDSQESCNFFIYFLRFSTINQGLKVYLILNTTFFLKKYHYLTQSKNFTIH